MSRDTWVAIDFETATERRDSACAVGVAVLDGFHVVETRSWLIQPPANEYRWFCTNVHGITADDTAQSPEFDEVWCELGAYLEDAALLAHNATFDAGVLGALLGRHAIDAAGLPMACTLAMARRAFAELPNHRLDTVCERHGIALHHHDAGSDAEACARVAVECARATGSASIGDALDMLGLEARLVRPGG